MPRKFEVKAGQHQFKGGETVENNVRQFLEPYSHQVQLVNAQGLPLGRNIPYYIHAHDINQEFYGRTDHAGKTNRIFTKNPDQLTVKVGKEAADFLLDKGIQI